MELTRRQRAEKALVHAEKGSARAGERSRRLYQDWWESVDDLRYALEIEATAKRELELAIGEEEAVASG